MKKHYIRTKNNRIRKVMRIRHSTLPIEFLDDMVTSGTHKINGVDIRMGSQRYKLFKQNKCCVKCGIEGEVLAVEIDKADPMPKTYHINMYSIGKNGEEILMTKDHIVPRSKGGRNALFNYQTMCATCNQEKGNGDPPMPKKDKKEKDKTFDTWINPKTIEKHLFHKLTDLCELVTYIDNKFTIYQNKNKENEFDMMYPVFGIEDFGVRLLNIELKNGYYVIEE